jgi:phosphoribosyl 1,2-cyclic phosphate phosphodiesterase
MSLNLRIMGCGNSAGVPAIGNRWGNCDPNEPKNRRSRPSALLRSENTAIVIDTGPDFREQLNRADVSAIDAVFYTHAHGDHLHGLDDLRTLRNRMEREIPMYGSRATVEEIEERFQYMFIEKSGGVYLRVLRTHVVENEAMGKPMTIGDITFTPFRQDHGTCESIGLRVGDLAYCTDVVRFNEMALDILKGVKTWVIDAAGYVMPKNLVHMTLRQIYEYNKTVRAEQVYLTHLTPAMDYATLVKELPAGYSPAYDGLELSIGI